MMRVVIKFLLLLLLGCGAVLSAGSAMAESDAHGGGEAPSGDAHGGGDKKEGGLFSSGPTYIKLDPIIMPVMTSKGPQQLITMLIALQVKDLATSDKVREKLPKVTDAMIRSLYGQIDESKMHGGQIVDLDFVKTRITKAADSIMGPGVIDDVLIQAVSQRLL
jgi:flagellar protein FliL